MKKKIVIQFLVMIICAFIFSILSLGFGANYGGNSCNIGYVSSPDNFEKLISFGSCDCFCCHMFGVQGYESCGLLGFILGALFGMVFGFFIVAFIYKKYEEKDHSKR